MLPRRIVYELDYQQSKGEGRDNFTVRQIFPPKNSGINYPTAVLIDIEGTEETIRAYKKAAERKAIVSVVRTEKYIEKFTKTQTSLREL